MKWENSVVLTSKNYVCGYCNKALASEKGYRFISHTQKSTPRKIYICHHCSSPTFFDLDIQTPGPVLIVNLEHVPSEVKELLKEANTCYSVKAYTSAVMCCRKLLMNISVAEGAKAGESYAFYVDYLDEKGHIPPKGKLWVNSIKKMGNDANHKIEFKTVDDAELMIKFTDKLLSYIYEMPGLMRSAINHPEKKVSKDASN